MNNFLTTCNCDQFFRLVTQQYSAHFSNPAVASDFSRWVSLHLSVRLSATKGVWVGALPFYRELWGRGLAPTVCSIHRLVLQSALCISGRQFFSSFSGCFGPGCPALAPRFLFCHGVYFIHSSSAVMSRCYWYHGYDNGAACGGYGFLWLRHLVEMSGLLV